MTASIGQNLKFDILNIMALPSISQATDAPIRYQSSACPRRWCRNAASAP